MRRFVPSLAVAVVLTLLAMPAGAQPHPPGVSGLTVSPSSVRAGGSLAVSGAGAGVGATVTFIPARPAALAEVGSRAAGTVLGRTTAGPDGSFRATVHVPDDLAAGTYALTASTAGEVLAVATVQVLAAVGGPAFAGGELLPGMVVGAALIVAGGLLLLGIKRRRVD
jgi:hypothetical protein